MTNRAYRGLFVAEGTSDMPLADLVEGLFFDRGVTVSLSRPDFALLDRVAKDVRSRLDAGIKLGRTPFDLVVVHRDADNAGADARRDEIRNAIDSLGLDCPAIPVIPIRMTEAWLLLDETAIRLVAGNPRGRMSLGLPKAHEVESQADPKQVLSQCLLRAADVTGRRREQAAKRFSQHRRQLLERLDTDGPVQKLSGWIALVSEIEALADTWS